MTARSLFNSAKFVLLTLPMKDGLKQYHQDNSNNALITFLNSVNEHFIFICHGALLFRRHFQVGIIVLVQSRANRTRVGQPLDIDKDWPKFWTLTKLGQILDVAQ